MSDEATDHHPAISSARVYATGQPLPLHDEVLGSAVVADGALVWHVVRRPT